MAEDAALPDFEDPPIAEVVLAVHFERMPHLTGPAVGLLWDRFFSEQFHTIEERPPYEPPQERFGTDERGVRFAFSDEVPSPRYWLVGKDKSELLQVQPNWFARNWRKAGSSDPYPRYEVIRQRFLSDFETFRSHCSEQGLGEIVPEQCEISYINHIRPDAHWAHHGQVGRILTIVDESGGAFLPEAEDMRLRARWRITAGAADEGPVGRLHANVEPGLESGTGNPVLRFTLTARGQPTSGTSTSILDFFDLGREWIVFGFTELTTDRMHQAWGRKA